ncbi:MAG: DUF4145 domain-containing protein [Deltaproteobacteria bacterium]|nr:DUF4145 domain-containing protein [Deltaproteobacteria bacterium]
MEKEKELCASCKKVTNHVVLAEHKTSGDAYNGDIQWWAVYQIIQCLGCESISFREASACSEDFDPRTGEMQEAITLYPERMAGREPIDDYDEFPVRTKRVYLEIIKALNNQTPILAAIGLRALIESICLEQKTKSRTLAKGIDELADMGLLSKRQAAFLHNHRFMGNAAAHEIISPKPQHLVAALDIAETLLKTIYILPDMADQLKGDQQK